MAQNWHKGKLRLGLRALLLYSWTWGSRPSCRVIPWLLLTHGQTWKALCALCTIHRIQELPPGDMLLCLALRTQE